MLQINRFKTTKLTSCIIYLKWCHTARAHVTPHIREILHRVQKCTCILSQNNACKLNNYPHLLDRKLSTFSNQLQVQTVKTIFTFRCLHLCVVCQHVRVQCDVSSLAQSESRTNVTWWSHDNVTWLQNLQSLSSLKVHCIGTDAELNGMWA